MRRHRRRRRDVERPSGRPRGRRDAEEEEAEAGFEPDPPDRRSLAVDQRADDDDDDDRRKRRQQRRRRRQQVSRNVSIKKMTYNSKTCIFTNILMVKKLPDMSAAVTYS